MIDFSTTTTFGVVRRVAAAGLSTPSIYVLICEPAELVAVEKDLAAEIEVQLGSELRSLDASNITFDILLEANTHAEGSGIVLLTMRRWEHDLVDSIDRNVVLLTDAGPLLLLTSFDVAERILAKAPNLRSRLADVLLIGPDEALGGTH
jgi:hypothetical protein